MTSTSIQRLSEGARSTALVGSASQGATSPRASLLDRSRVRTGVAQPIPARSPEPAPRAGGAATSVSTVPAGTDPELWAVLTPNERAFFGRVALTAAPTYNRTGSAVATTAPAAIRRGLHLDVRA